MGSPGWRIGAFACPVLFGLNDEATGGLFRSEFHEVRLCGWRTGVFGSTSPARGASAFRNVPAGIKTPSEFEFRGGGVESTAHNCRKQLKKRVADSKHGFESRSCADLFPSSVADVTPTVFL